MWCYWELRSVATLVRCSISNTSGDMQLWTSFYWKSGTNSAQWSLARNSEKQDKLHICRWQSRLEIVAEEFGLEHRSVTHQVKQFTRPVQTAQTISSVAGTQTLDHLGPFKDMASCQKGSQKSLSQRFEKPVQEPSFCMGVSKTNRKCYAYEIPHVTDCGLVNGKRPRVLKIKVVAQETDVYFSLWKPSQTSNPHVKTHMEAEMLKCYEIIVIQEGWWWRNSNTRRDPSS